MALTLPSMPSALLSSVLSAESLAKNLQIILATLTPVGHELKAEERYLFDLIAAALVSPHILHHKQHTIKQTVLSCLREVVRISALDSTTSDGELLSPSSSSRSRNKATAEQTERLASDAAQAKQADPEEQEDSASGWKRKKSSNRRNTPRTEQRNKLIFTENQEQEQLEHQQHEQQQQQQQHLKKASDGGNGSDGGEAAAKESPRRPSRAGGDESLDLYSRRGSLSYGLPATYLVDQTGLESTQQHVDFRRKSSGDGSSSDSDGNKPWFLSRRNGTASSREPISLESQLYSSSGGEMGALFRATDWSKTPLGSLSKWPSSLKLALGICLFSRFNMLLWWGEDHTMFYNDSYSKIIGPLKHPRFFAKPGQECFPEIWHIIGPMVEYVRTTGDATWVEDQLLHMNRNGYLEECYFTYSYSPIFLEDGTIGGVFNAVSETTAKIINERQLRILREVATRGAGATSTADALTICANTIKASGGHDIPFASLYLLAEGGVVANLVEAVGCEAGSALAPTTVAISRRKKSLGSVDTTTEEEHSNVLSEETWSRVFRLLVEEGIESEVDLVAYGDAIPPCGPWDTQPTSCLVLPIVSQTSSNLLTGIMVLGVNPRHALDDNYRIFFKLFAGNVASAMANATAREEERRRVEALAELDRAKTIFFSNISHEFRTPLTLMLGPLEDLIALPGSQDKEQLHLIHRNALRLLKLVNSLLDFSRLEAGKTKAVFEPTDLSQLTQELSSIFRSTIESAGMKLVVDCPALSQDAYVDRDMWEKIVLNLLSNALKFTLHGQIEVHLAQLSDTEAELRVTDTGIGIPESELQHIGKRFHRITTEGGRSHEGTGIGLALVYELVHLHGGTTVVESQLGKGSTFRIRIPLGCAHLPQSQIKLPRSAAAQSVAVKYLHDVRGEQAEGGQASVGGELSTEAQRVKNYTQSASWWLPSLEIVSSAFFTGPDSITALATPPSPRPSAPLREVGSGEERRFRVLLADDNFDMREYVTKLLSERYDVTTASNGMEALAMVQQQPIDLVLTDVMMPVMDGFTLLKELRATSETRMIPVILLSARAGEESKVEGLEAGADDYLIKPFTARELLARVGSHLDMVRMRSEAARREQELRFQVNEAKERLERIISSIQDAFVSLDRDLRYAFANDNAALIAGAKKEDMLGRDVWDFMADTEDKVVRNNLERAIRQQIDVCFEFYYPAKDRWYEHRMYPAVEGGASIFTLDITARKKSEERLSVLAKIGQLLSSSIDCHLPSLLASILKIAAGSVVADWCVLDIVEERGTIERIATPTALANKWKMTKLPWEKRVDPKKYHMVVELCNGDRVGVESDLSSEDDSFIAFPLAARGKVFGTWLFARHHPRGESRAYLEEDKAACEELARRAALAIDNIRLYQDAENANQAKDHFLAALSHELRTPLTPALLLSEALLTEDLPPAITENIKTIHESVELEVQLIDDLLDLTKIARGKLQLHSQELSAHELLGRTLQIVAHDIANKKLNVGVDPRASGDRIVADPARLQQVFWNIIKNAIKFTPENGSIIIRTSNYEIDEEVEEENQQQQQQQAGANADADGTATVVGKSLDDSASAVDLKRKMKSSGGNGGGGGGKGSHIIAPPRRKVTRKKVMLRVEVQDTGIGIEANIIPHLFHAFEQGDSSITIRFGGLGLGLAISRSLVEMHSGALSADSEGKGKGATFTIVLPTIHTSTPSPQLAAAAAAAALPPGLTLGSAGGARRSGGGGASAAAKFAAQQAPSASIRKAAMSPSFTLGSLSKMRARDSAAGSLDLPARRPSSSSTPSSPSATTASSSSSSSSPGLPPPSLGSSPTSRVTSASPTVSIPPTPATSPSSTANRSGAMHPGLQQFAMTRASPRTLAGFPSTPSPAPAAGAGAGAAAGGSMMAQYPMPPAFCIRSRSTPILPSASYASSSLIAGSVSPLRPAASIRPLKVLLVEDNKSTLLIMSRLLQQRLGYQVFVASTVKDALDVAEREQGKFDLVISDIGLPDGTGLQLMKVLRENYRLKGIALSGYGMEEDVKRSKTAGFEVHLTKPVNFSSLTAAIHRVIPPFTPPSSPTIAPTSSSSSSSASSQSSPASPRRAAYLSSLSSGSSSSSASSSTPSAPSSSPAAPPSSPRLNHREKPRHDSPE